MGYWKHVHASVQNVNTERDFVSACEAMAHLVATTVSISDDDLVLGWY